MTDQIFDAREFRNALGRFATGVAVITTVKDGKTHGMTTNAFVPVSLDPPLVLISLNNRSHMHQILPAAGRYGISVLAEDQCALSNHFAGQTIDDLHIRFINHAGAVLLDGAIAHFVAKVVDVHSGGDHTLYVGSVEYFASRDEKPLLFYGGRYQRLPS